MDSGQDLVLIDTNIFVIDLRYKRDPHYADNHNFLTQIAQTDKGFTTIINLLELCGVLSFNLNRDQLRELWYTFQKKYKMTVLPEPDISGYLPRLEINKIFNLLQAKTSFGDALMIATAEENLPFISTLISWDKEHLQSVFHGSVMTPAEYLHEV